MISEEARKRWRERQEAADEARRELGFANTTRICPKCSGDLRMIGVLHRKLVCENCASWWYYDPPDIFP